MKGRFILVIEADPITVPWTRSELKLLIETIDPDLTVLSITEVLPVKGSVTENYAEHEVER